jgi:shikimate dehydrogenase
MITGKTTLVAHLGYPTEAFKAPMIYNPYFEKAGVDAVVVPMGVRAEDYPTLLKELFKLTNIRGALVTMPHKVTTVTLADEVTPTATIAGSANALLKRPDGSLLADMFDGTGFVRGVERKGRQLAGASALVVGSGESARRSRRRWRRQVSAGWDCTMRLRPPPRPWADG